MTTIIRRTKPGSGDRRCDATCHNATRPKCKCVCGGKLHGAENQPGGLTKYLDDYLHELQAHLDTLSTEDRIEPRPTITAPERRLPGC